MKTLYVFSLYALFTLVYLHEFGMLPASVYQIGTTAAVLLLLISALSMTRGFLLYVSLISLAIGHKIVFSYNLGVEVWYSSLTKAMSIPVLFVVLPLLTLPLKYGRYLHAMERYVLAKRSAPGRMFAFLSLLLLALTVVLNIGSILTMQQLLENLRLPKKFLARLYTTGYAAYVVFSPYDAGIQMILLFASTTYSAYCFGGILMASVILIVSSLLVKTDRQLLHQIDLSLSDKQPQGAEKGVSELLIHIGVLIGLAFLADRFLPFSLPVYRIAVVIIGYSVLWSGFLHVLRDYGRELRHYRQHLLRYKSVLPFLLCTSFLGSTVSYTPFKTYIGEVVFALQSLPLYIVLQLLMLLTMALSVCGVHMMITVTTLAFTLPVEALGLSPPAFALTLLTCWLLAMSLSPFVPFAVIVAETIGTTPVNVTLKQNFPFALAMLFLAPAVILLVNTLILAFQH